MNFRKSASGLLVLFLLAAVAIPGCARPGRLSKVMIPSRYRKEVRETIKRSGENAAELQRFLLRYRNDRRMLEAASFLVANLPVSDAASMTADELSENLDYAFRARREMPWGRMVPWETFLHFVLPHRASGEPHQRYRRRFYEELAPLVRHCSSMSEAALKVNEWCFLQASYKPSSWRDQGPLTTIKRGWGRCEEEMILYISAARSVGIPARQCYTPKWQHCNSNHAWVEVWTEKGWGFLGSCEPALAIGEAWFAKAARRAAIVVSTCYGNMKESKGEIIYRRGRNFALINSTPVYTTPCDVRVTVIGKDGKPKPGARVFFGLYNFGYFGPIAAVRCDEKGSGHLVLGESTVLISTRDGDYADSVFVHVKPGADNEVTLDLRKNRLPEGGIMCRFHHDIGGDETVEPSPETEKKVERLNELKKRYKEARMARLEGYKRQCAAFLRIDPDDEKAWEAPLAKALLQSAGNCGELIAALAGIPPEYHDVLVERITRMDRKDLLETSTPELLIGVPLAVKARKVLEEKKLLTYPDDVFFDYVLPDRIYRENHADWRPLLYERFFPYIEDDLTTTVRRVNEYTKLLKVYDDGIFGGVMNPLEVVKSGAVVREDERAIAAVGILRAIGIPARYLEQWGWLEYFDGKEWKPFYPADPDNLGNKKSQKAAEKVYAKPAVVEITFLRYGKPLSAKQYQYFRDFNISVFTKAGYFRYFEPEGSFDEAKSAYVLKLPPGEYFLTAGRRNTHGEPYVRIFRLKCKSGERLTLEVDTDLPVDTSLPVVRNLKKIPAITGKTLGGELFDLRKTLDGGKPVLLVFFDTSSEPCVAMMPMIDKFAGGRRVEVVGICIENDAETVKGFVSSHCPKMKVIMDGEGKIRSAFGAGVLPSILLITPAGKVIMWTEGHNLQIEDLLEKAFENL